ncbi:MAG: hypothetical protein M1136_00490 [Chloroflexi bacterium]|nr:hypothetical protein [Chloroflexota bacterium]MCL5074118.1 hypothetical protein [Chloroflexota bacterium]
MRTLSHACCLWCFPHRLYRFPTKDDLVVSHIDDDCTPSLGFPFQHSYGQGIEETPLYRPFQRTCSIDGVEALSGQQIFSRIG